MNAQFKQTTFHNTTHRPSTTSCWAFPVFVWSYYDQVLSTYIGLSREMSGLSEYIWNTEFNAIINREYGGIIYLHNPWRHHPLLLITE